MTYVAAEVAEEVRFRAYKRALEGAKMSQVSEERRLAMKRNASVHDKLVLLLNRPKEISALCAKDVTKILLGALRQRCHRNL